jgi:hypothetical protein
MLPLQLFAGLCLQKILGLPIATFLPIFCLGAGGIETAGIGELNKTLNGYSSQFS